MTDRKKRHLASLSRFFWSTIFFVSFCVFFLLFNFSTVRYFAVSVRPVLISTWRNPILQAISDSTRNLPSPLDVQEVILFPDQILIYVKSPSHLPKITLQEIDCVYTAPEKILPPISITTSENPTQQIVRCPSLQHAFNVSLRHHFQSLPLRPLRRWDLLVFEALIDSDNTTVTFVKGLNLRPERLFDPTKFECLYGWDFDLPKFLLSSPAISVAQEIVRCKTPLILLKNPQHLNTIKVSVRDKDRRKILPSVAHPIHRLASESPHKRKRYEMCVCTMIRNQSRFLKEWVMYHARIGVQRWFIYDNNSDDSMKDLIETLNLMGFNLSIHSWPWIKTQEAGFSHCALRSRNLCNWVGFIDVDEFLYLPSNQTLHNVLKNHSNLNWVGELRTSCHSFGPSGLKKVPEQGVTVSYICRVSSPERHKSIVRPDALNGSLINVVHHFHLKDGFDYVNVERSVMVINHYKYQVWEVFKEKFYRRVAAYVADWTEKENEGSKDRAPGLGTEPVEPPDWSNRFCEVTDTGLRDLVLRDFVNSQRNHLPWVHTL